MINGYLQTGYLILKEVFDATELKKEAIRLENEPLDETYIIEDNNTIRSLFAPHWKSKTINEFIYNNNVIDFVKEILGQDIYIHQCHINYKKAQTGGEYAWHSDYTYWKNFDGMNNPDAISVLFLLDDMTKNNGPLTVLEKSQNLPVPKINDSKWTIKHSADESQGILDDDMVSKTNCSAIQLTGKAGDVICMHANTLHYSGRNTSEVDRNVLFVCYNKTNNAITQPTRPNYIVLTPIPLDVAPYQAAQT
jgi:ectoine hydroxylase